ncbi:dTMP kinase [Trueperella sp. LYQ143]|uniref:dTMP kinase n=1 Tax=unclassified Trueperella TaxID=2630174 RepID=UPI003983003E
MAGCFISFEGGDGTGKSTQAAIVAKKLEERGYRVCVTREPGGTELGKQIRHLLLHGSDMGPRAEALLYAADRAHHVDTVVRPALERGEVVLTDRYLDSSVAYQGVARQLGKDEVRNLSMWATNDLLPDVTILLDLSPEASARRTNERTGGKLDRLESAGDSFHAAVRKQFLQMAQEYSDRFAVVNADQTVDEVAADVWAVVEGALERRAITVDAQ